MNKHQLVVVSVLLCLTVAIDYCVSSSERFYIVTSRDRPCPGSAIGEPCLTLQQYASNPSRQSNVTLELEQGQHSLLDITLGISNIDSLQFIGESESTTVVTCRRYSSYINIDTVSQVQVKGITFVNCSVSIDDADDFTLEDSTILQSTISIDSTTNATVSRSNFSFNGQYGLRLSDTDSALIEECTFADVVINSSPSGCIWSSESNITISQSSFTNISGLSGALYAERAYNDHSIIVVNSNFTRNNIGTPPNNDYYYFSQAQGLLRVASGSVEINGCKFINNSVFGNGGVFVGSSVNLSISESTFVNNTASGNGGAIFNSESDSYYYSSQSISTLSIHTSSFINNLANQTGGALYASVSTVSIHESSFDNNTAIHGGGGVLYSHRITSNISVSDSTFTNNTAAYCGVLQVENAPSNYTVNFSHSAFHRNKALGHVSGRDEGAVACLRSATFSISNSALSHNYAKGDAGVAYVDECTVNTHASTFHNNRAGRSGGVFTNRIYSTNYNINQSSFTLNYAASDGGVLYVGRASSRVNVSESSFELNSARNTGGIAVTLGSQVSFTNTSIVNNTAYWGGVFRACNSEIVTPNVDLFIGEDPTNPLCSLYYESNTTIPQEDTRENEVTTDTSDTNEPTHPPAPTSITRVHVSSTDSADTSDTTDAGPVTAHNITLHTTTNGQDVSMNSTTLAIATNDQVSDTTTTTDSSVNMNGSNIKDITTTTGAADKTTPAVNMKSENTDSTKDDMYHALTVFSLCVSIILLVLVAVLYVVFIVYAMKVKTSKCLSKTCSASSGGSGDDSAQMTSLLSDKESNA